MTTRNKKIGDRKSDLFCTKCDRELEWEGSIMEGKMVCKNVFCMDFEVGSPKAEKSEGKAYVYKIP